MYEGALALVGLTVLLGAALLWLLLGLTTNPGGKKEAVEHGQENGEEKGRGLLGPRPLSQALLATPLPAGAGLIRTTPLSVCGRVLLDHAPFQLWAGLGFECSG